MNINYSKMLVAVIAAMVLTHMPVQTAQAANEMNVRHRSGEITWIDVRLGLIQIRSNMSPGQGEVREYRINRNDTRVTDPMDEKFLTIDDLQAGQYVVIDVIKGQENKVVQKIVAEPYLAQEVTQTVVTTTTTTTKQQ